MGGRFVCQGDMHLLLIHGLGRTPLSLALLGQHLSQHGHIVRYFGYAAFQESLEQIVGAFADHELAKGHTNHLRASDRLTKVTTCYS